MTNGGAAAAGGAAAGAAAAAIANAVKASGAIVRVEPREFSKVLERTEEPLVVFTEGSLFGPKYQYLTAYKGLIFYTKTKELIALPARAETVPADKIWIPG